MTAFQKDPAAVLDYAFDWSAWLAAGETITAHTITVTGSLVVGAHTVLAGVVTAWLSGGVAGETYTATCHITTSQGRQDERSIAVQAVDR